MSCSGKSIAYFAAVFATAIDEKSMPPAKHSSADDITDEQRIAVSSVLNVFETVLKNERVKRGHFVIIKFP